MASVGYFMGKFRVTNKQIEVKANEYIRLADVRGKMFPGGGDVKNLCCFVLACQKYGQEFDRSLCARICGSQIKFQRQLVGVKNLLGIKDTLTIKELSIKFGLAGENVLIALATEILDEYDKRYRAKLPLAQRQYVDFSGAAYKAACFYLAAKTRRKKVDRKRLLQFSNTVERQLSLICKAIAELVPDKVKLPVRKVKAAQGGTATQGGGVDTEADDTEEALLKGLRGDEIDLEDAESNPALADSKVVQFERWKRKCIEQEEVIRKTNKKAKKTKQTKLSFS